LQWKEWRAARNGGFIVTGGTGSDGADPGDVYLTKVTPQGDVAWTRRFGGAGEEVGHAVLQAGDGGYVIAGWTDSLGAGSKDAYVIRTDADGTAEWSQTYGDNAPEMAYSLATMTDGFFVIAGRRDRYGDEPPDAYAVGIAATGEERWSRRYGGGGLDEAWSVDATTDGGRRRIQPDRIVCRGATMRPCS
jgi:hypothetical protein